MTNISAVMILDKSGSMRGKRLKAAQTATATFVNIMKINDDVGVVSFSSSAWTVYPFQKITSVSIQNAATDKISAINAWFASTDMSLGISTGFSMLPSSPKNSSMVMYSDGDWTSGTNPLTNLETSVPIYTIALMAPQTAQTTLSDIATRTKAKYYHSLTLWDFYMIYNEIAAKAINSNIIKNLQEPLTPTRPKQISVPISSGNDITQIAVNWNNQDIPYTSSNLPGANQIAVKLKNPSGQPVTPTVSKTGPGFVVLDVANPVAGNWNVFLYPGLDVTVNSTAAMLEPKGPSAELTLDSSGFKKGDKVPFSLKLHHDGNPVKDAIINVLTHAPLASFDDVVKSTKEDESDHVTIPVPHHVYPTSITEKNPGEHHGEISADIAGSYTVEATIEGKSPVDGVPFARCTLASVHVTK